MFTCAASLHSTTLVLKSLEAALFFSTQQLDITNATPSGTLTSCSRRGLKSIFFAYITVLNISRINMALLWNFLFWNLAIG